MFLAGNRAWKLKKSVNLGFLDFSTLPKRHQALVQELAINQQWAPDLYRAVHPIALGTDGQPRIGGDGEPIEWILEMHRFDQSELLSAIAERRGIDRETAEKLGRAVSGMHATAEVRTDDGLAGARVHSAANRKGLTTQAQRLGEQEVSALLVATDREIKLRSALLEMRVQSGFCRRCHGDLHLRNIILRAGQIIAFDALEFDERLAEIDILHDLAFLLMDCAHAGQAAAANRILNTYIEAFEGELAVAIRGLALLPLFLSLRSATRAHVTAASGGARANRADAKRYLREARQRLLPARPTLIAIGGLSGTGKSTVARGLGEALAPAPGPVILRSDSLRKRMAGVAPTCHLDTTHYSEQWNERVRENLFSLATACLHAGSDVILDATFMDASWREQAESLASSKAALFQGIWLDAPADVLRQRIEARSGDVSDADHSVLEHQLTEEVGPMNWSAVAATGAPAEVTEKALRLLQSD